MARRPFYETCDSLEGDGRCVEDDAHVEGHLKGESQGSKNTSGQTKPLAQSFRM